MVERLSDQIAGRWRTLLPLLGVHERYLSGSHGPCPMCGGKDRWRFDDKLGRGTWYCNKCGAGDGIELVKNIHRVGFREARKLIFEKMPNTYVQLPRRDSYDTRVHGGRLWGSSRTLTGDDPASLYLKSRHLWSDPMCNQIRYLDKQVAMIAQFVSDDVSKKNWQITYLTEDGEKADVSPVRKTMGSVPKGGAVRLSPSAETMGIAEGVETALAAQKLFDVPVWATFSCHNLAAWKPPSNVRHVIVFGDNDPKYAGQYMAYGLAHSLSVDGYNCEVRIPDLEGDWADVLEMENR